jgi:hypothetical protein
MKSGTKNLEYITRRIDVKGDTLFSINESLKKIMKEDMLPDDAKLIITTNFGIIEGDFDDGKSFGPAKAISMTLYKLRDEFLESKDDDSIIVNNTAVLQLFNVSLKPFASPKTVIKMELLNLFTDQITGFTIGTKQIKIEE